MGQEAPGQMSVAGLSPRDLVLSYMIIDDPYAKNLMEIQHVWHLPGTIPDFPWLSRGLRMLKAEGAVGRLGPRCNEMCGAVRTLACDGCDGGCKLLRSGSQPQACHRKQSNLSVF